MADGIGGAVKRQLDKRVSFGHDITNATEACHILQSTMKTFPCVICKTRQRFILQEMAKCMVCKKWVCKSCSGTTSFDYICPVCLSD
ncbi:unnamed protein product [Euphydryas editha]|uniref:Uncharacterized protein n=1 Tax=Euphydryas editha TaxID=104508 RepID=A0AAU9VCJ7_EUPED|nr:unnamed protein product [Euphydryas editha]